MPLDWVYSPIVFMYSRYQQQNSNISELQQIFIITNCLRWILIYEIYFPQLASLINPTDKFCRLACVFVGSDSLFLNPDIHKLLQASFALLLKSEKDIDFSTSIQGELLAAILA